MSKKVVQTAAEGLTPKGDETSGALGSLPDQKTSLSDPRTDTASLPNPLQRKVTVGRHGTVNGAAPENLESLRGNNE